MKKILIFAILLVFILPTFVSADIGPKPSIRANFYYNGNNFTDTYFFDFNVKVLLCLETKMNYSGKDLIPQLNISTYDSKNKCYWQPSGIYTYCHHSLCDIGGKLPSEFKLAVYIPSLDKVFITNEISKTYFNSRYKVELSSDGSAKISDTTSMFRKEHVISFIEALILTLIIELIVAFVFISNAKLPNKVLVSVLIANIISLPIVWFIFPLIKMTTLVIILSEIFAAIFEAYFIYYLNKQVVTLKQAVILSLIMNLASFLIGGFIFLMLG